MERLNINVKRRTAEKGGWFYCKNELLKSFKYSGSNKPYLIAAYTSLSMHANKDQYCFPSQELIAEQTGMSIRSVKYAIKALAEHRLIVVHKAKRKLKTQNYYLLTDVSEWKMESSALDALRSVHKVPTNNTQKKKKKIVKTSNINQLNRERANLTAKFSLNHARAP